MSLVYKQAAQSGVTCSTHRWHRRRSALCINPANFVLCFFVVTFIQYMVYCTALNYPARLCFIVLNGWFIIYLTVLKGGHYSQYELQKMLRIIRDSRPILFFFVFVKVSHHEKEYRFRPYACAMPSWHQ